MTRPATATTDMRSGLDLRIGIDVGGTWIKGAIIKMSSGSPVGGVRHLRTPTSGTVDAVADTLHQLIDELGSESLGHTDSAVGVLSPR
jgi:polyphosphate glucokinase